MDANSGRAAVLSGLLFFSSSFHISFALNVHSPHSSASPRLRVSALMFSTIALSFQEIPGRPTNRLYKGFHFSIIRRLMRRKIMMRKIADVVQRAGHPMPVICSPEEFMEAEHE